MAGLWNLSFQQLHDLNGSPYPGAKAYFYAADSLTPITVYQDYGLGTAHPNPVEADANGVFPPVFLDEADTFYRQRITTSGGVIIGRTDLTVLPIIGPSGGGGGSEVPVDANTLFQTGDLLWLDTSSTRAGWVRDNGRTIGSATSGASERANSDCEQLYLFGWAKGWSVTGGAGVNAAADWAANKPITLPDKRGFVARGLDDMGNTAALRLASVPFLTGNSITAGSWCGSNTHQLINSELPVTELTFSGQQETITPLNPAGNLVNSGFTASIGGGASAQLGTAGDLNALYTPKGTISSFGGNGVHNNVSFSVLGTFYRKL